MFVWPCKAVHPSWYLIVNCKLTYLALFLYSHDIYYMLFDNQSLLFLNKFAKYGTVALKNSNCSWCWLHILDDYKVFWSFIDFVFMLVTSQIILHSWKSISLIRVIVNWFSLTLTANSILPQRIKGYKRRIKRK